jgi:hypothetical protein
VIKKFKAKEAKQKVPAASKSPSPSTGADLSPPDSESSMEIVKQWPAPMLQYSLAQ